MTAERFVVQENPNESIIRRRILKYILITQLSHNETPEKEKSRLKE